MAGGDAAKGDAAKGDAAKGRGGNSGDQAGTAPSFLDRKRAAWPWFDHLMRAANRYMTERGDHYAAAITYFTVLSLFPLLMVAFSIAGFVLAGDTNLMSQLKDQIADAVPGNMGDTISDLVDTAVHSRGTVGIIGLLGALYTGLGWMAHLRAALTEQWDQTGPPPKFVAKKLHDLGAMIGLGIALVITLGVSAIGSASVGKHILKWMHLYTLPGAQAVLTVVSVAIGIAASWVLFVWVIARLPREHVPMRSAFKGALLAAIVFEIFKRVAVIYLAKIVNGPAGATFGPIIGIMVFAYMTSRIALFATAFAATSPESMAVAPARVPDSAVIRPRVRSRESRSASTMLAGAGVGLAAGLGVGRLRRRSRR